MATAIFERAKLHAVYSLTDQLHHGRPIFSAITLKAAGDLIIAFAILAAVVMPFIGNITDLMAVLPGAISAAFGGIVIIAFGLMLEHLEAISRHSAMQTELLSELLRKTPKADSSHKAPARSLDQLAMPNFRFKEI